MAIFSPVQDFPGPFDLLELLVFEEEDGFLSVVSPKKKFMERDEEDGECEEEEEDTALAVAIAGATWLLCAAGTKADADVPNASRQTMALRLVIVQYVSLQQRRKLLLMTSFSAHLMLGQLLEVAGGDRERRATDDDGKNGKQRRVCRQYFS